MFRLQNFKNFTEATLSFDEPVTLLIGPNGAGKSNLIEAVELLCFLVSGRPLYEITDLGREGRLEVRGGLDACARRGSKEFTLGYKGIIETFEGNRSIDYTITVRVGEAPRISAESLHLEGAPPVFEVLPGENETLSADNRVRYDNHARGRYKPEESIAGDRSAISQYSRFARKNKKLAETLGLIDAVMTALSAPAVFDPIPKLMRGYERETETRLARNGFNLSPVLAELYRKQAMYVRDPKTRQLRPMVEVDPQTNVSHAVFKDQKTTGDRILTHISQLPDESFKAFDFVRTKTRDVMFGFRVDGDNKPITAQVLSDGTLRALAVLTALETSLPKQRIIVEEFDNGIHPSRVRVLTEALFDCSTRNSLRSLVTTHNPATLNALTVEQLDAVLLVAHTKEEHHGRLIPLRQLPGYIEFIEQGRLGDLITRRIYEQHLGTEYEQERSKDLELWINNLP